MNPSIAVPPPPKARSAEAHLEGLGTIVMLKMRQRIIKRLEETETRFWMSYVDNSGYGHAVPCITQGELFASRFSEEIEARDRAEFADWMIRRMAEKRLKEGQQMDSIIAASYKAFLPNLMAQALKKVK
jgi:hypothetical protein